MTYRRGRLKASSPRAELSASHINALTLEAYARECRQAGAELDLNKNGHHHQPLSMWQRVYQLSSEKY
jgi:hypothetical protein